jgi:hypothetical protein
VLLRTGSLILTLAAAAVLAPSANAARPLAYDLNGDGRQELVIGLPDAEVAGPNKSVGALVIRGSRRELLGDSVLLTQEQLGLDADAFHQRAGEALTSGDFDGDGTADLAVGMPGYFRDDAGSNRSGAVTIVYGSTGFPDRSALIEGPPSDEQTFPAFGSGLAAGRLNRGAFSDLVVGATGAAPFSEDSGEVNGSGALHLLFGSSAGLTLDGSRELERVNRRDKSVGLLVAVADINLDSRMDVLEAAPGMPRSIDDPPTAGHVSIGLGHPGGLTTLDSSRPFEGGPTSVGVGDVTAKRFPDFVAGIGTSEYAGEDESGGAGMVWIRRGGGNGFVRPPIPITQDSRGIPGSNQGGDRFGQAVAVGRIDNDRYADIVVGAPGEDDSHGRVTIIRGGRPRYNARGNSTIRPGKDGVPGKRGGRYRFFGGQVALLDLTGDGRLDLCIGSFNWDEEPDGNTHTAAALTVVPNGKHGLAPRRSRKFELASFDVPPVTGMVFGQP